MGAKEPKNTTQTNTVQLSPEQEKIAGFALPSIKKYASTPTKLFSGSGVAGFSPTELQAQQTLKDAAGGTITDLASAGAGANKFLLDPSILSPDSNPFLAQYGDNLTRTITENLTRNILPTINRNSIVAGGPYSAAITRPAIAEGLAIQGTNAEIGGSLAKLYSDAYGQGLDAMGKGLQLNPTTMASQLLGGEVLSAVGGQERAMEQELLNSKMNKFYLQQQLPFLKAQDIMSLVGMMPGGSGVSTVSGATPGKSPIMSGLGGAASGAALGSMVPGVGTAIGAGLGGLLGLFG